MVHSALNKNSLYAVIASIALCALGYLGFLVWGGWNDVIKAIDIIGFVGLLITLFFSLVNYGLRFARWQIYLDALKHPVPAFPSCLIYIAGFSLTTTPGKAGEMLRGIFLKHHGVPYKKSTAAFLSEKLSDLTSIVLLALFGFSLYPHGRIILPACFIFVTLIILILYQKSWLVTAHEYMLQYSGRLPHFIKRILSVLIEACCCHSPIVLIVSLCLSFLAWSSEAYAFYLILQWMKFDASLSFAFSVYAISTFVGAISFIPGGVGTSEVVMVGLLMWAKLPAAEAVAATIIIRLATLWFAVILGVLTVLLGRQKMEAL